MFHDRTLNLVQVCDSTRNPWVCIERAVVTSIVPMLLETEIYPPKFIPRIL